MSVSFNKSESINIASLAMKIGVSAVLVIMIIFVFDFNIFVFDFNIVAFAYLIAVPFIVFVLLISLRLIDAKLDPQTKNSLNTALLNALADPRFKLLFEEYNTFKRTPTSFIKFITYFIISMIFEELVFRVLLFDMFNRAFPSSFLIAAIISSIIFGMFHAIITMNPLAFITTAILGFLLCMLYIIGGFFLCLFIHVIWDGIIFIAIFALFHVLDKNKMLPKTIMV